MIEQQLVEGTRYLLYDYNDHKFKAEDNYLDNQIEDMSLAIDEVPYIINRVEELVNLAVKSHLVRRDVLDSVCNVKKYVVSKSSVIKLFKKLNYCGFENWNFNYIFDNKDRNINIWNFNHNSLSLLCDKKDLPLESLFKLIPGFEVRYLSHNESIEDINEINRIMNNIKNPRFIVGLGEIDSTPRTAVSKNVMKEEEKQMKASAEVVMEKTETKRKGKTPKYITDPENYIENNIDPRLLDRLIKSAGWSYPFFEDVICSGKSGKNNISIYYLKKETEKRYSSIPRQVAINMQYYLQSSWDFLTGKRKDLDITRIPAYAVPSIQAYYTLNKFGWETLLQRNKKIVEDMSKEVGIPFWIFKEPYSRNFTKRMVLRIIKWFSDHGHKYKENDLFYVNSKMKSDYDLTTVSGSVVFVGTIDTDKKEEDDNKVSTTIVAAEPKEKLNNENEVVEEKTTTEVKEEVVEETSDNIFDMVDKMSIEDTRKLLEYCEASIKLKEAKKTIEEIRNN